MTSQRKIIPLTPWHRSHEEIIAMIALRNVLRGKPSPVAAKVLERLERVGGV